MNIDQFNIVDSVEEIMMIQKRKAAENNIKLYATYENIGDCTCALQWWCSHGCSLRRAGLPKRPHAA